MESLKSLFALAFLFVTVNANWCINNKAYDWCATHTDGYPYTAATFWCESAVEEECYSTQGQLMCIQNGTRFCACAFDYGRWEMITAPSRAVTYEECSKLRCCSQEMDTLTAALVATNDSIPFVLVVFMLIIVMLVIEVVVVGPARTEHLRTLGIIARRYRRLGRTGRRRRDLNRPHKMSAG